MAESAGRSWNEEYGVIAACHFESFEFAQDKLRREIFVRLLMAKNGVRDKRTVIPDK